MKKYLDLIDLLLNDERIINKGAMLEYIEFISDMLEFKIDKSTYIEKHHILPRSLFPDEINNSYNLIKLLPKYHYKAHVILAKMYEGGMLSALHFMENRTKNQFNYYENLEIYNELRIKFSKMQKKIGFKVATERWANPKIAKQVKENMKLAASKPEFKEKSSINANRFWNNKEFEDHRQQQKINHYNALQKEDYKEKHRNNQKERMQDPELRAKCGWRKGLSRPAKTCPWCNQTHNTLGFFDTHFENCRNKKDLAKRYLRVFCILNIFNNLDIETKLQLSKYELNGKEKERRINFMFYKTPNLIGTHEFFNEFYKNQQKY